MHKRAKKRVGQVLPILALTLLFAACGSDGDDAGDAATDTAVTDAVDSDTAIDSAVEDTTSDDTMPEDSTPEDTTPEDTTPEDTTPEDTALGAGCEAVAEMTFPAPYETLRDFTGSEDFAFDGDGNLVSTDEFGNLVRQTKDGTKTVFLPNVGLTAGTGFLPDGDLILASVDAGELWRITPDGGRTTLLSGLLYPNGLDIDPQGFIYIAEQDGGRVRRVDSVTGEFTILADGLSNANGVSFGPGYTRLYVGSFGGGVIWAIDKNRDGAWGEAHEFARTPNAPGPAIDPCDIVGEDAPCFVYSNYSIGKCERLLDSIGCAPDPDAPDLWYTLSAPCQGIPGGGGCSFDLGGQTHSGICESQQFGSKQCVPAVDYTGPCETAESGDTCVIYSSGLPFGGRCTLGSEIDTDTPLEPDAHYCLSPGVGGEDGGLDGLNVDACGYVYVTEYLKGVLWRFAPEGGDATLVMNPNSEWIPNMHFGKGVGGWDSHTLYIMDREGGRVFGLELPVPGKAGALP